jgi:hypothetical protein
MANVKITALPKRSRLPAADEMVVPVYPIPPGAAYPLYACSVQELANAIRQEVSKDRTVRVEPVENDGIRFIVTPVGRGACCEAVAPVIVPPCPFCGGPPVPIVRDYVSGGVVAAREDYGDDGLYVEAFVFCHECGAQGSHHEAFIYDRAEYIAAEREGVRLWRERDERNRSCYDAGARERLNEYPRPNDAVTRGARPCSPKSAVTHNDSASAAPLAASAGRRSCATDDGQG